MDYPRLKFTCGCEWPRHGLKQGMVDGRRHLICHKHKNKKAITRIVKCDCGKVFETSLRSRAVRCENCQNYHKLEIQAEYRLAQGIKPKAATKMLNIPLHEVLDLASRIKIKRLERQDVSPCVQGCTVFEGNGNRYNNSICPYCEWRVAYAEMGG